MKLSKYNCEYFGMELFVKKKHFNENLFIKSLPTTQRSEYKEGREFQAICKTKSKESDYHAHIEVGEVEGPINIRISLTSGRQPRKKTPPPYAEDVFKWLSKFISDNKIHYHQTGGFVFQKKKYDSVFNLPMKLKGISNFTCHPILENADLNRIDIRIQQNPEGISNVMHFVSEKAFHVGVVKNTEASYHAINISRDIKQLQQIAKSLVRKRK